MQQTGTTQMVLQWDLVLLLPLSILAPMQLQRVCTSGNATNCCSCDPAIVCDKQSLPAACPGALLDARLVPQCILGVNS